LPITRFRLPPTDDELLQTLAKAIFMHDFNELLINQLFICTVEHVDPIWITKCNESKAAAIVPELYFVCETFVDPLNLKIWKDETNDVQRDSFAIKDIEYIFKNIQYAKCYCVSKQQYFRIALPTTIFEDLRNQWYEFVAKVGLCFGDNQDSLYNFEFWDFRKSLLSSEEMTRLLRR